MIPDWNNGILPPIRPRMPENSLERSPYPVSMCDLVEKFAFTERRKALLKNLLSYREALCKAGIEKGFQWIDGSFTEHVEQLEMREPNDIDVVTFFRLPDGLEQQEMCRRHGSLFELDIIKSKYEIDAYYFLLGEKIDKSHVRQITYWYSMWSHRRDGLWKGFLRVEISSEEDRLATQMLN